MIKQVGKTRANFGGLMTNEQHTCGNKKNIKPGLGKGTRGVKNCVLLFMSSEGLKPNLQQTGKMKCENTHIHTNNTFESANLTCMFLKCERNQTTQREPGNDPSVEIPTRQRLKHQTKPLQKVFPNVLKQSRQGN